MITIPGLVPGIFFLLVTVATGAGISLQLAEELYSERQWEAARRESQRARMESTTASDLGRARLLEARALLRMEPGRRQQAMAGLETLWQDPEAGMNERCRAAYELGVARRDDREPEAFEPLRFAFLHAGDPPLFWRAGCTLYFLMKAEKRLRREEAALWQSLQSCRDAWPLEVWRECRPRKPRGTSWASRPGRGIVRFYRAAIGPAIGSRCDLQPSCSEYFLHASHAHGLLGIPIMADRFIREPSVVAAKEQPVVMPSGRIRYADPLSDHDFWLKGKK